ncbi:MAG TPA: phosphatase PAP2 family protein [Polyangiales bacterium]|nr:phosphatase PAP2 family protein [Polyangiales bacterium]
MLLFALATAAFGAFLKLTSELTEGELEPFDHAVLSRVIQLRTPGLNGIAVDITALGSVTVVSLITSVAVICFAIGRHWSSVAQLIFASIGGGFLSTVLKHVLERERPAELGRLVQVASFSYPSGHSLAAASVYVTLAITVARLVDSRSPRVAAFVFAFGLSLTVGFSRAYLGVHYPSDIAAGLLLGTGWAFSVGACFSYLRGRGRVPSD